MCFFRWPGWSSFCGGVGGKGGGGVRPPKKKLFFVNHSKKVRKKIATSAFAPKKCDTSH